MCETQKFDFVVSLTGQNVSCIQVSVNSSDVDHLVLKTRSSEILRVFDPYIIGSHALRKKYQLKHATVALK